MLFRLDRWFALVALVWPCAVFADLERLALVGHLAYPSVPSYELSLVPAFEEQPIVSVGESLQSVVVLASPESAAQFTLRIRGKDFFPDGRPLQSAVPYQLYLVDASVLGPNPDGDNLEALQERLLLRPALRWNARYPVELLEDETVNEVSLLDRNKAFATVMRTIECRSGYVLADVKFQVPMRRDPQGRQISAVIPGQTYCILLEWIDASGNAHRKFVPQARFVVLSDFIYHQAFRGWEHSPEQDTYLHEARSEQCYGNPLTFHSEYPSEMAMHVDNLVSSLAAGTANSILLEGQAPTPTVRRPNVVRRLMSALRFGRPPEELASSHDRRPSRTMDETPLRLHHQLLDMDERADFPIRRYHRLLGAESSGVGIAVRPLTAASSERRFQQRLSRLSRQTNRSPDITRPTSPSQSTTAPRARRVVFDMPATSGRVRQPPAPGVPVVFEPYLGTADDDCPICMQTMEPGDAVGVIQCGGRHTFCATCMQLCMSRDPRCPICRATVDFRQARDFGILDNQ